MKHIFLDPEPEIELSEEMQKLVDELKSVVERDSFIETIKEAERKLRELEECQS
jgi:hypothetical protein